MYPYAPIVNEQAREWGTKAATEEREHKGGTLQNKSFLFND